MKDPWLIVYHVLILIGALPRKQIRQHCLVGVLQVNKSRDVVGLTYSGSFWRSQYLSQEASIRTWNRAAIAAGPEPFEGD